MSDFMIFTRGDKANGMGHVVRCLVLADELRRRGHGVLFATEHETPGLLRIRQAGYPVLDFAPVDLSWTHRFAADTVIIDIENGPPREMLEAVRPHHSRIVVIGGSGNVMHDMQAIGELADLFICQTVLPADGDLTGPEHIIIDPAFAECQPDPAGHILVSFGGGDPHGLTPYAVDGLRFIGRKLIVVNGPASSIATIQDDVAIENSPLSLVPLMSGAVLFAGALGMSAFEAAAAGVPAILTAWSADHAATASELADVCGCAVSIGMWDEFDGAALTQAADDILHDEKTWRLMSAAGKALVDGKGAARVADAIEKLSN